MEQKLKQRICIEFCVKLQISATETFEMLNKAFPNDAPKRTTVFEWHSRFKAGRISIEDDPQNPRTTLLELEQDTGISKTTIGRIVTEDLKLKKTPAKFIPRFLTNEQKLCRLATCEDMMEMTRTDPEWKDKIITGDETWVYGYDPETKPQSAEWRGQTVIMEMYLGILRRLREAIRKKRPEKWTNGGWILHHDNARPHTAHLMTSFLAKNGTQILLQPPYFPDIAPNDFFLFPKLKAVLKGRHFGTRNDIIEKSPLALKSIPKEAYKNCFDNWEKRWRWFCGALRWKDESSGMCCSNGKVRLPLIDLPPEPLRSLLSGENSDSVHFLRNIRKYNSCFQMTSFGAENQTHSVTFPTTFSIQGQVYHRIGSLMPSENQPSRFLQIYFMGNDDDDIQTDRRCQQIQGVRRNIVQGLQRMLHQHNLLVQQFKTALENLPSDAYRVVVNADRTPPGQHPRRYNAPTADEVAVVLAGNQFGSRDIVLHQRDNLLQHVSDTHRFYDALQYPLIFWKGQEGYSFHIPQIDPNTSQPLSSKVSSMDFYGYFIMVRRNSPNVIVQFGQLFHQFLVDMYAKVESERLRYITLHQRNLRAESYIHLRDALSTDANINPNSLGQRIILPSSFVNSPRYLAEYTQDAFCYVRKFGRPDLFITFTSNPSWEEISAALLPGQKQLDRHDITARVFRQKLVKFIGALTKGQLYGAAVAWMYFVEWQKRGLPHAHILVWLANKLRPTQIDSVICAEFPDPIQDPLLYNIVIKNMIHGPCGEYNPVSPCMKNSSCSKKYPKQFLLETQTNENGYPLYRRRAPEAGGFTAKVKIRGREEVTIDNRWVVPYSPLLSKMFCAHINVENCSSVKAIKYICKYVNKGSDQAIINLRREGRGPDPQNEVRMYQCARYISSNEAVWRLLSFPLHQRHPAVIHLAVHLENGERIYFNQNTLAHRMRNPPRTTLTAFFSLCQTDSFARTLLYPDVPQYYTWNSSAHEWRRRVQGKLVEGQPGVKRSDTIGRVYAVHVSNFECFCLRMLLHNIKGPTSFAYLKIVNGSQYETFRETCAAIGLLENDNHWVVTMDEAVLCQAPTRVRQLFAILISTCTISNPQQLWITYRDEMASDIHRYQLLDSSIRYNDLIYNETLCNIEDRVVSICGKKLQELGLGAPRRNVVTNSDILRELAYDTAELEDNVASMLPKLLPEQRRVFDAVLAKINLSQPIIIFLDAPGEQDIRDDPQPMGGLVVLLAGDFRQTLPVVTRGTPTDELNACLKSSYLWSHIVKMHLTVNMRVQLHNDTTAAQFADELLKIGEGQLETDSEGNIQFSNTFCQVVESSESLYEKARILTGSFRGEEVLIPRIPIIPNDLPFKFRRLQFPVMVAFAMTINKSQGQTLQVVGSQVKHCLGRHSSPYPRFAPGPKYLIACVNLTIAYSLTTNPVQRPPIFS
ncbi:hypothetical protein LAZ67_4002638 [Cordylochernes scorpioides]|uniref:ATP-dependent DNA helicase n=1 Tax=Cordylochernes scorpioides TaxID=51811 RepID=A0ABY6KG00_9ARAC|nr:hypothetical protein LAZ67_4002638 [Cordylochernes scorpioides]